MRNRYDLKIKLPHEEDDLYHQNKVEAMMSAEEEFWRDNPDEYDRYLNYEREEYIPEPTNEENSISYKRFYLLDAMKPLALLLFIQYGVVVTIVWWNFDFIFV